MTIRAGTCGRREDGSEQSFVHSCGNESPQVSGLEPRKLLRHAQTRPQLNHSREPPYPPVVHKGCGRRPLTSSRTDAPLLRQIKHTVGIHSMLCVDCGRDMRPYGSPNDGRVRHEGRGLCRTCHRRHVLAGSLIDFERLRKRFRDTVEDWEFLRVQGYTRETASMRLGISKGALEKALTWQDRKND